MTSPRTSKSHLLSARKLMSACGIDSWHLRRLSATESQVFAPCSAEKSHLHCCGTAQPFKRCGTQSPARQQPRLPSATSFVASAREAYRTKDHVKPPSDEASDGSTCAHRQLRSLSHLLHIHFTALMFSANMIWIIEAWAAPRRCLETHSSVRELGWEYRVSAPRCVVLPHFRDTETVGQCISLDIKRAATRCSAQPFFFGYFLGRELRNML